ncbi:MAG TPA: LCP family protein [Streptosporangiaceae bacterium]
MSEFPDGWFRNDPPRAAGGGQAEAGPADPTVRLPGRGGASGGGSGGYAGGSGGYQDGGAQPGVGPDGWPAQPPPQTGRPARTGGGYRRSGWRRPGRWIKLIASLIVLILIVAGGLYFYLDSKIQRSDVLANFSGRPVASAGSNWLIAGSDSRQGLSRADERKYSTGRDVSGQRSDTIMLLHVPANGTRPVLVSLPRDSYVPIPGYGHNKLNAAFSFGGPKLLAQTVQEVTGLRIDHFMDIGFGGFVNVVNAIGGVTMCLPGPLKDSASGLNLKAGCQTLNGGEALGYVRDRHDFANQDLQRIQDQRLFLKALLAKLTSTGTTLNPFASVPAAFGTVGSLTVDSGTHLYQLIQVAFALRNPETTTVPIANANLATSAGDAVEWDSARARELFADLGADRAVPRNLLSGSSLAH